MKMFLVLFLIANTSYAADIYFEDQQTRFIGINAPHPNEVYYSDCEVLAGNKDKALCKPLVQIRGFNLQRECLNENASFGKGLRNFGAVGAAGSSLVLVTGMGGAIPLALAATSYLVGMAFTPTKTDMEIVSSKNQSDQDHYAIRGLDHDDVVQALLSQTEKRFRMCGHFEVYDQTSQPTFFTKVNRQFTAE